MNIIKHSIRNTKYKQQCLSLLKLKLNSFSKTNRLILTERKSFCSKKTNENEEHKQRKEDSEKSEETENKESDENKENQSKLNI